MASALVTGEPCELIKPLIPQNQGRFRYPGRKRVNDREMLSGITFVLTRQQVLTDGNGIVLSRALTKPTSSPARWS